jgi:hypothetical protein
MKSLAGVSVLMFGFLIFLLLALAIYVFRSLPYILALVLIAEIVVLVAAIIGPLLAGGARRGWFGRAVFALIAVALANSYMLFLANRWGVAPSGWERAVLHWQEGVIAIVWGLVRFVVSFLDAVLRAVLGLSEGPIGAFFDKLRPPSNLGFDEPLPGVGRIPNLPLATIVNVLIGVLGSLWTASVVKGVLPRSGGSHGKAAGAHH